DDRLKRNFGQITLPLFILHGSEDHATKPSGSREFHDHAGSKDKTLKIYEGHYHDLLADLGKEEVMGDVIAWLDRHVPA
ncbi:MAG TPA: alpha/beta hydrolase, partial [Bauldia sp.]|nr:alpha/beta hydrolase [Bauldia sp.]